MISESTMLTDDFEDEVLSLLRKFNMTTVNSVKRRKLRADLESTLVRKQYISFNGHYKRYLTTTVGSSYLYDVPLYKQGHLSKFRGKRVRIICLNSGSFTFGYRAGIISKSPPDKVIKKLQRKKINYTFHDYLNSHKVVYKSPRFRVIQVDQTLTILSKYAPKGYVETAGWDSILLDGKIGEPIATLNMNADGTINSKEIRWGNTSVYQSLREAIDELKEC